MSERASSDEARWASWLSGEYGNDPETRVLVLWERWEAARNDPMRREAVWRDSLAWLIEIMRECARLGRIAIDSPSLETGAPLPSGSEEIDPDPRVLFIFDTKDLERALHFISRLREIYTSSIEEGKGLEIASAALSERKHNLIDEAVRSLDRASRLLAPFAGDSAWIAFGNPKFLGSPAESVEEESVFEGKDRILGQPSVKMELPRFINTRNAPGCVSRRSSIASRSSSRSSMTRLISKSESAARPWWFKFSLGRIASRTARAVIAGGGTYDHLKERRFEFVPLWGILVFLTYRMRRVDCPRCGVTVEIVPWSDGKNQLTTTYRWFLASWARRLRGCPVSWNSRKLLPGHEVLRISRQQDMPPCVRPIPPT